MDDGRCRGVLQRQGSGVLLGRGAGLHPREPRRILGAARSQILARRRKEEGTACSESPRRDHVMPSTSAKKVSTMIGRGLNRGWVAA
jgi:hypothetical protein